MRAPSRVLLLLALLCGIALGGPVPLNPSPASIPSGQFFPWALDLETGRFYWTAPIPGERAGVHGQLVGTILGHHEPSPSSIFTQAERNRFIVGGGQVGANGRVEVNPFQSFSSRGFHEDRVNYVPRTGPPRTLDPAGQRRLLEAASQHFGEIRDGLANGSFPYSSTAAREQAEWANPKFAETLEQVNAQTRQRVSMRARLWTSARRVGGKVLGVVGKGLAVVSKVMTVVDVASVVVAGVGLTIVAIDRLRTAAARQAEINRYRTFELDREIQRDIRPQLRNQPRSIMDPDGKPHTLHPEISNDLIRMYEMAAPNKKRALFDVILRTEAELRRPSGACP